MIEDIIREAMERGDFDNLPGKGRPLNLTRDPLLDPLTAIVHRILLHNGVSHPLIEARRDIAPGDRRGPRRSDPSLAILPALP